MSSKGPESQTLLSPPNETAFGKIFHRLYENSPTCIFIMKESVSMFEIILFLFVLGGYVAWIFVFNSSLRIKGRKNPTLLSAYAASPEV